MVDASMLRYELENDNVEIISEIRSFPKEFHNKEIDKYERKNK